LKTITVTSKRQITIPKEYFDKLGLKDDQKFTAILMDEGILLVPIEKIDSIQININKKQ